jgi:hypothetical protein
MGEKELFHMLRSNTNKSPDEILQEEFLQERAAVLGRAGDSMSKALEKLHNIEQKIEACLNRLKEMESSSGKNGSCHQMIHEINREINKYNQAREYALLRYYYLIVTREAMGMRRHHWVEQQYHVPPRKKRRQDIEWIDIQNNG